MQKARRHRTSKPAPTACRHMGSGTISLFCSKCFSPFPHGTGSLSVSGEYLALPDGPGRFTQDSSCPALLRILLTVRKTARKGLSPAMAGLSSPFRFSSAPYRAVLQPPQGLDHAGLGSSPFARHYWGNHYLFSLPAGTKMFQFPALASRNIYRDDRSRGRVVPFGNLRVKGHLRLTGAYRSLSRPSSPP